MHNILIEGYTIDEILDLPNEQLQAIVLRDEPLIFKIGTANILGSFKITSNTLRLELAQIDGGGEGALPSLAALANRYAKGQGLAYVEWYVHAVRCAKPNLKLRHVLERRGFAVRQVPDIGECYWLKSKT